MFEKIVNIGMRILGIFYILDAIIIFLGYLTPSVFSNSIARLIIAVILLFGTYYKSDKTTK